MSVYFNNQKLMTSYQQQYKNRGPIKVPKEISNNGAGIIVVMNKIIQVQFSDY